MKRFALFLVSSIACMPRAMALRPFDGTDAAVARKGTLEFEFGYLGLLREDQQTFLQSPALVANAGSTTFGCVSGTLPTIGNSVESKICTSTSSVYSLISRAKANGVDPEAWLRHALAHIVDHLVSRVDEFLAWSCAKVL